MKISFAANLSALICGVALTGSAATSQLLGWNNLGMHCMDSDFSVFSILPPYNTIEAQLIVNGRLVTNGTGYSVTYQAVADPDGSINSTSIGKGNFYQYTPFLYGAVAPDVGLLGWAMPGAANTPQAMLFERTNSPAAGVAASVNWWRAEGIPITPLDDALRKNAYPLMRLVARDAANNPIATNDIVLPVSDEMDCRACHASGSAAAAMPAGGWVNDPNPERNYRLNILLLHDQRQSAQHGALFAAALATKGYNPSGLYASVVADGKPVLCAACHPSEALQGSGLAGIPPLTTAIHSHHAGVTDPLSGLVLNSTANRSSCYRCHPGSTTKCLRGAMGSAVAADGSMEMQCQSCHGSMSMVGSTNRVGWFMEPNCQSCHTGTATSNNGQIRYTSSFTDANGTVRVAVNQTFATSANAPAAGLSLFRFSKGHGGLQCSACHGSTHAEFPTSERNDNLRDLQLQGHAGQMAECSSCHATVPSTSNGGPHGMHPVGQTWVSGHRSAAGSACQACHGTDYRGTVLSRMLADRTLSANGTQVLFRGATVGCYLCHNGPGGSGTPPAAPTVSNVSATTTVGKAVSMTLPASGSGLTLRIISQPANGTVGLSNTTATYFPEAGFSGVDTFTFAAYNGSKNSQLGTGTVTVTGGITVAPFITTQPASQSVTAGASVSFTVAATGTAPLSYQWRLNGANLAGATSATLTLSAVTTANAGTYTVLISNAAGSVTSAGAVLTVNAAAVPPTITLNPAGQTVTAGATVTFTVAATGTAPLSYQWQKNGVAIPGATAATLTFSSVTTADTGTYAVVVRNVAGSVTSAYAILTVNPAPAAPSITTQPVSQTVTAGASVSFSVTATGTAPLSYQWQKNGVALTGATSATLSLSSVTTADAGSYAVVVRNAAGSVTSAAATLTVNVAPVAPSITAQPVSQTVTAGASVSFSVTASGTAPLSYQWQKNGIALAGATSATLTLSGVTTASAGSYTVVVRNAAGSVTSGAATLTVNASSTFTVRLTSPANGAVFPEGTRVLLTASVSRSSSGVRVRFYDGTSLLGSDTSAPFSILTTRLGSGSHVFTARATDASGRTVTSAPIQIRMTSGSNDD